MQLKASGPRRRSELENIHPTNQMSCLQHAIEFPTQPLDNAFFQP